MAGHKSDKPKPPKEPKLNTPFKGLKIQAKAAPEPKAPPKPVKQAPEPQASTDNDLFLQAMSGVERVGSARSRIEPQKTLEKRGPSDDEMALMELKSLVEGDTPFALTESEEFVSGIAPGVTQELLRELSQGTYAFRRHIDLHGHTKDEAKEAVTRFIPEARRDNERCVLIVTGRGKSSPLGMSVIKEALPRWLSRAPLRSHVLAFCTAKAVHGGPGAFYVLLRRQGTRPFGVGA